MVAEFGSMVPRRSVTDLCQLLANAKSSGAKVVLTGMGIRSQADLVMIARNSGGQVSFED